MPIQQINQCDIYYETHGAGRETLLFSHGLMFSTSQFHHQIDNFKKRYHIMAYDHRGQGRSAAVITPHRLSVLTEDVAMLIQAHQLGPVHFVGTSLGGVVGLALALNYPHLVKSLTLVATNGGSEMANLGFWLLRMGVQIVGISPLIPQLMHWLFGATFLQDDDRLEERLYWQERLACNRKTVVKSADGIARGHLVPHLAQIRCPTLLLAGTEDKLITLNSVRRLQAVLPNAVLKLIYHAGHNPLVEEPHQCHHAMERFLRLEATREDWMALA